MNKTNYYFDEFKHDNKEQIELWDSIARGSAIRNLFADLYFNQGYDLLLQDAAEMLDVDDKYLMNTFSNKFDYIIPPSPATKIFTFMTFDEPQTIHPKIKREWKKATQQPLKVFLRGLARKRVFIHRESFFEFLKLNLKVYSNLQTVVIENEFLNGLKKVQLDKIRDEYLSDKSPFDNLDFTDECLKSIVENHLWSGKTIKQVMISTKYENDLSKKIYDTQLYRWLDNRCDVIKVHLQGKGQERPIVRYLFPSKKLEEQLKSDLMYEENKDYIFSVPSTLNGDEVKKELIAIINEITHQ